VTIECNIDMKFGKVLKATAEEFPEKRFVDYNKLKKLLKTISSQFALLYPAHSVLNRL